MDFKNKKLVTGLRVLFGAFFVFSGAGGLMSGTNFENVPQPLVDAFTSLWNSGLLQMIKTTELIAGGMLLFNIFPALAIILLAPIIVGILVFNAVLAPQYVVGILVFVAVEAYFGYVYWDNYKALFEKK